MNYFVFCWFVWRFNVEVVELINGKAINKTKQTFLKFRFFVYTASKIFIFPVCVQACVITEYFRWASSAGRWLAAVKAGSMRTRRGLGQCRILARLLPDTRATALWRSFYARAVALLKFRPSDCLHTDSYCKTKKYRLC